MKAIWAIVGLLTVLLLSIGVVAVVTADPGVNRPSPATYVERGDMLESDAVMLQEMRASASPVMMTMIQRDPMWTDPEMIRAQEEYQAQIDRMLGRRPGQP